MFGVENLVLSKSLSTDNTPNTTESPNVIPTKETTGTKPLPTDSSSFFSINTDYDSIIINTAANTSSLIANTYKSYLANFKNDLANRLDSMSECPSYLNPKLSYTNLSQAFSEKQPDSKRTLSRTISNKSSSSEKAPHKFYYTDDFILLSEFSEIEGPKPLLTIPTDGGKNLYLFF